MSERLKAGALIEQAKGVEKPERWLVIAHEASNSGASRMLLEVLRGVRAVRGSEWSCEILLRRGGVLLPEFSRLGAVHVLSHHWAEGPAFHAGVFRRFVDRPWVQPHKLADWLRQRHGIRFDLIYNNTATNEYLVPAVRNLGGPVLTHVHESAHVLKKFLTPAALAQTIDNTDHFLAVSLAVASDLAAWGILSKDITIVPNFLHSLPLEPDEPDRRVLREQFCLPSESFVVVGCGHIHGIKGTDIFVETAAALSRLTSRRLSFVWLGSETDTRFARKVRRLVRRRKLESVVRFVGPVTDTRPWFAASDVVAVTSRVESFSLVALEAAALGRPVVGFSGARGLVGLLGEESGWLVTDFDPAGMASLFHAMLQNPSHARQCGQRLRAKVEAEFLVGPRISTLLSLVDKMKQKRPI